MESRSPHSKELGIVSLGELFEKRKPPPTCKVSFGDRAAWEDERSSDNEDRDWCMAGDVSRIRMENVLGPARDMRGHDDYVCSCVSGC